MLKTRAVLRIYINYKNETIHLENKEQLIKWSYIYVPCANIGMCREIKGITY